MKRRATPLWGRLAGLAAAVALTACAQGGGTQQAPAPGDGHEHTGEAASAVFLNGGFETGTAGQPPPSWTVLTNQNFGITLQTPQTKAGLNLTAGGDPLTITLNAPGGPETQTDPGLGAGATFRWPKFGNKVAIVNGQGLSNNTNNHGRNVNTLTQTMTVGAGDIDPSDGQIHVRATLAPVLENPNHAQTEQPYFYVQLTNLTTAKVLYQDFNFSAQPGVAWKVSNNIYYTDWTLIDIPGGAGIKAGDSVQLEIIGAGCSLGGHYGQVYVDSVGTSVPGLFVAATAPKAANAGTNITYTLNYKDGSPTDAAGVKVDFNTPPNTTFVSLNAPGLTCTDPGAGNVGLVQCTIGALKAGASGTYTITLNINAGATGVVTQGDYDIYATAVSPLYGSKVTTIIGCYADSDCQAGNWCHISPVAACLPTLPNGTAMPIDAAHANPTLNGTCNAAAGALVCTSAVCDVGDSKCGFLNKSGPCTNANAAVVCRSAVCDPDLKCGYANGDGTCTQANAAVVCRSGVCDPDGKCGYANGDGPCTAGNGGVVCRSTSCSVNGLCQPAGGCNVDADCGAGLWCNESQHVCAPKLANGVAIPTDPPHQNPTLNGTCSAAAGTLVCTSAVCDTKDNLCGYLNGDGPCTAQNGATVCRSAVCDPDLKCGYDVNRGPCTQQNAAVVCRSAACSANGLCEPAGGCNVDADCGGGTWCFETTHTCTAKVPNGTAMPTDAPHSGPTLNGKCTAAAALLVCAGGVCDASDDKCGFPVGVGPCTQQNGATVCRSTACSVDGTCEPAGGCNVDGDCAGGFCFENTHTCTAPYPNGQAMPNDPPHKNPTLNGTCTAAAATLVCQAKVCDLADSKCGYANGDGPCTKANQATVCRSTVCSVAGTCMAAGSCNIDGDCSAGNWCAIATHTCTPTLANGKPVPSDPPHQSPTLDGTCTPQASALVCTSGVCDTKDNLCGYDVGEGPCTKQDAIKVCRSGACSVNGLCEPAGGCNVDGDCSAGNWCNVGAHTCTPTLANGKPVPSDPPHKTPTLDGKCSAAAGTLVCTSGVCDTKDDLCGYLDGDGPCTQQNGATVCRSSKCSANGLCQPSGGCNVDADCSNGNWCAMATHACTPTLGNGLSVPTDAPHQNPTLNGKCTQAAATLTCTSGVCDVADDKCGYATGDGPCTQQNGANVCRSGSCSANGLCEPAGGCNVDADCSNGNWCNEGTHTCTPKLANGLGVPSDPPHQNPTLNGKCTQAAATLTCTSGVCDAADDKCGYANDDGPCTKANGGSVCRSGACSIASTCMPQGGCNVDGDCGPFTWCNIQSHACSPTLDNGQPVPSDPPHKTPTLDGTCTPEAGKLVCISLVCDANDGLCGYADGTGPCDAQNAAVVCRSKSCGQDGLCKPAAGCNVDGDCPQGEWCNESVHACAATLPNGQPVPVDPPHAQPTLDGTCTPEAGALVCTSGVCDGKDNLCGYADGDGPCTPQNAGSVCRSGACSANGLCQPAGGCNVDGDCAAGNWCNIGTHTCTPTLPNSQPMPTDPPHQGPTLDGTCTADAGKLVCTSGVCDKDNLCGYADGSGPCTQQDPGACRSGKCSVNGLCEPKTGCNVDADCSNGDWCEESSHTCKPKLANGAAMPKDAPHSSPTLDGKCTADAAKLVCASAVCDPADDKCGLADGDGPCTGADGGVICRSGVCTNGLCGAPTGCKKDSECPSQKPVCDVNSGACVECTAKNATKCTDAKPICDAPTSTCVPCDGDLDSGAKHACAKADAPLCLSGSCDKCASDADCKGNPKGPICDVGSGTCLQGCHLDADCAATEWCDGVGGAAGVCHAKLDNGSHLPKVPPNVSTCDDAVGARVCKAGVCDTKDDTCGLLPGDGPCNADSECRTTKCDLTTQKCAPTTGCTTDAECPAADYCRAGACTPKQPEGALCAAANECESALCEEKKCSSVVASGNGACAVSSTGSSNDEGAFAAFGLALAAMGLARRRRR